MLTSKKKDKRTKTVMTVWKKAVSHNAQSSDLRHISSKNKSAWSVTYVYLSALVVLRKKRPKKAEYKKAHQILNGMTSHHTHCTCVCDYVSVCGVSCWIPPLRFRLSNQGPKSKQSAAGEACLSNLQLHSYSKMTLNYIPGLKLRLQPAM